MSKLGFLTMRSSMCATPMFCGWGHTHFGFLCVCFGTICNHRVGGCILFRAYSNVKTEKDALIFIKRELCKRKHPHTTDANIDPCTHKCRYAHAHTHTTQPHSHTHTHTHTHMTNIGLRLTIHSLKLVTKGGFWLVGTAGVFRASACCCQCLFSFWTK